MVIRCGPARRDSSSVCSGTAANDQRYSTTMERRNLLKAVGGIAVTASASGVGVLAMSGGASATGGGTYGNVDISSDDGTVDYVAIFGNSTVEWDGFDRVATQARIVNEARVPAAESGWIQLNDTGKFALSQGDSWGGSNDSVSGEGTSGTIESGVGVRSNGNHDPETDWHVVGSDPDNYPLPTNSVDPSNLENPDDGTTNTFAVETRATYEWYDSSDNGIFSKTFNSDITVDVTNEEAEATATGRNSGAVGE